MEVFVNQVVAELRPMLAPDGGRVELVSCDGGVVQVKYVMGHNDECADCVMSPGDFELYLKELLTERVPGFKELRVTDATAAAS